MSKRLLVLFAILLVLLSAVPALAQDEGGGGGTLIGAFDIGPGGCPQCLPYFDTAGRTWMSKIWTPLVSFNSDMSGLVGQLATEWSSNEEATVWTFNLREGVLWHDGEPFTADDVVFSLNLALNPDAATQFPAFTPAFGRQH